MARKSRGYAEAYMRPHKRSDANYDHLSAVWSVEREHERSECSYAAQGALSSFGLALRI